MGFETGEGKMDDKDLNKIRGKEYPEWVTKDDIETGLEKRYAEYSEEALALHIDIEVQHAYFYDCSDGSSSIPGVSFERLLNEMPYSLHARLRSCWSEIEKKGGMKYVRAEKRKRSQEHWRQVDAGLLRRDCGSGYRPATVNEVAEHNKCSLQEALNILSAAGLAKG